MTLSPNEIKKRAIEFSKEWENETSEDAEAKSFWDAFFLVFDITRRRIASFEKPVKKSDGKDGFIDLLWKGKLLVEHKSRGKNLDKALGQAFDYFPGLKEDELPRYIIVSDFERFRLYDIEEDTVHEFHLSDFHKNVHLFGFITGIVKREYKEQDPVNILAAEKMGKLHDALKQSGYSGHDLEVFLVRIVFCLFADDTGIFNKDHFSYYLEKRTREDGSDLGERLSFIFQILNTPPERRQKNLDEDVAAFPYVNGMLFAETLPVPQFDSAMRAALLECSYFDWSRISPAIFGSMFQSVMDPKERRNLGAHYTSEKNILKVVHGLFLDELQKEFDEVKTNRKKLEAFHEKISRLTFLDPACGCGNFLIITYRELRLLELEILKQFRKLSGTDILVTDVGLLSKIDVDALYGIELEEFPARIAEVALWLMDHQMNLRLSEEFGQYYARLPLKKSPTIVHGNALRMDWKHLITRTFAVPLPVAITFDYILGNPPFIGKQMQGAEQKADMDIVFDGVNGSGVLDFVTCWYIKAAQYIQGTRTKVAFVSTNSISQGEQVGILWNELFNKYKIKIHFAHRTFRWSNEAKGVAAVHVVIEGFANYDVEEKYLYEYDDIKSEPHEMRVKNINPYLVAGNDLVIKSRTNPLCDAPSFIYGNKIVDDGNFLFDDEELASFLKEEPQAKKFLKPILSGSEFINGRNRWCLYLKDAQPSELKQMPRVLERVQKVKEFRLKSPKKPTQEAAKTPTLFAELRQPENDFVLVPRTSSENRKYIPIAFYSKDYIVNDSCIALPNATLYHFAILTSEMHMVWTKYTCGRLKSDFRYSNSIVYNNYPWPESPTQKQKKAVEDAAQKVLDVRKEFPNASLADLYDPLSMPPALARAHTDLDRAVDACYRPQPFTSETKRIEYLFELYNKYTTPLAVTKKISKREK